MKKTIKLFKDFAADESGATSLEYGLIAAVLSLALILGATRLAGGNDSAWSGLADKVEAVG